VEAPTSTPTPETKMSPETKASPATSASPSASPATQKKEAKESATAKKESAEAASSKKTTAAAGPDTGSAESNVKRLEDEWEAAVIKHDVAFVQTRIGDDYTGTSSKGKRLSKAGLIKEVKGDNDTYTSAKNAGVTVRSYGPSVAIATGTAKEVGKGKDGKAFSRTYAWTDTWMMRNGKWECIGSQSMLVSGK
jgi:outer membrane biosynthesis protein TonB